MEGRRFLRWLLAAALAALLVLPAGCGDDDDDGAEAGIAERFATSLHSSREGKATWYNDEDGFGSLVTVDYADLPCAQCHDTRDQGPNDGDPAEGTFTDTWSGTSNCLDCHQGEAGGPVNQPDVCYGCHGRQATEASLGLTQLDVHIGQLGFTCTDCHTDGDVHGDGNAYTTMFEPGAIDARCQNCHGEPDLLGKNDFHNARHMDNIDCSACHMTSAVACYNCHFDNEGDSSGSVTHAKFASAKFGGAGEKSWRFLLNRVIDDQGNTKIYPGSMQSLMADSTAANAPGDDDQGVTHVAIGPYFSHSIQKNAITCEDCHASAAMQQYVDEGQIDVVTWKPDAGVEIAPADMGTLGWNPPRGVIPIPPNPGTVLNFDFVDLVDPAAPLTPTGTSSSPRVLFKRGADNIHLLDEYMSPLTPEQLDSLGWFNTSLHGTRNGKETFYNDGLGEAAPAAFQEGFGNFVDVDYTALPCADCHNGQDQGPWDGDASEGTFVDTWPGNPVCRDCHGVESPAADALVDNAVCAGCHGRLAAETAIGLTDVHLDGMNFACADCHALSDIHGTPGVEPATMFDQGALTADCQDCHDTATALFTSVTEHQQHMADVDCSTCHMQSVVTCYNCHFDNEAIDEPGTVFHAKFASAKFGGTPESGKSWRFLVNKVLGDGTTRVFPGSMQTLVADVTAAGDGLDDGQGESFVAIAPYYAHAIGTAEQALQCLDCHGTQNALDIAAGTPVQVVGWDATLDPVAPTALGTAWQAPTGVIPVPENPDQLLLFDFVDLTNPESGPQSNRVFFESGPDHFHLLDDYVRPLSPAQIQSVGFAHNTGADCGTCHPLGGQ